MAVTAGIGMVAGMVGTLGIKAVFAYMNHQRNKQRAAHPLAASTLHPKPTSPPPPATREEWEKHGFGPAIVGAEVIGGFTGRWPPLSEMGRLANIMTWATGIGYGLIYGMAITPWTQQPIIALVLFFVVVIGVDYGLLVPWGIFKPPWKEGHAFYFNLMLYGVYCILTVAAFYAISQML